MMSLCCKLAVLLLFLTPDSFLHSSSPLLFTHAAPTSPPVTRPRIVFVTGGGPDDDYYDEDNYSDRHSSPPRIASSTASTPLLNSPLCEYNPCLENQEPCSLLAAQTRCLCPGLSGANQPPHPPRLQRLVPGDARGKVEVQWCAPPSVVSGYRVVIGESGGGVLEFGGDSRRGLVGSLAVGAEVCVEAVNEAGHSVRSESSCQRYEPPEDSSHALRVGVIGGGVAFIILLSLAALILWRCKACRKAAGDSAEGLGNPSYSTEGTL